jgi:uncharacterized protein YjbI with pentapeptide repeats
MTRSKLVGAKFIQAKFDYADLSSTDLRGAHFRQAVCHNTSFSSAILIDSDFSGAKFKSTDIRATDTTGADFQSVNLKQAFHNIIQDGHKIKNLNYQPSLRTVSERKVPS